MSQPTDDTQTQANRELSEKLKALETLAMNVGEKARTMAIQYQRLQSENQELRAQVAEYANKEWLHTPQDQVDKLRQESADLRAQNKALTDTIENIERLQRESGL